MITIQDNLSIKNPCIDPDLCMEQAVFFDIETTGFSPAISSIYLIGCCYKRLDQWHLIQWFADDYNSEREILIHFFEFIDSFHAIVHFNGNGFDIPYIQKKCIEHKLTYDFTKIISLDLYPLLSPLRTFFGLPNKKQKSFEAFLEIYRKDLYSGGELIPVYTKYLQNKILNKPYEAEYESLLLHNKEDLKGLVQCSCLLAYRKLLRGAFRINSVSKQESFLSISISLYAPLPKEWFYETKSIKLALSINSAQIEIPFANICLKHFYPNYKDYYYLLQEDTAIHKSVAQFVDKAYKTKAKASTCYTKKTSHFLPQKEPKREPVFQPEYRAKDYFFEPTEEFIKNDIAIKEYILELFELITTK